MIYSFQPVGGDAGNVLELDDTPRRAADTCLSAELAQWVDESVDYLVGTGLWIDSEANGGTLTGLTPAEVPVWTMSGLLADIGDPARLTAQEDGLPRAAWCWQVQQILDRLRWRLVTEGDRLTLESAAEDRDSGVCASWDDAEAAYDAAAWTSPPAYEYPGASVFRTDQFGAQFRLYRSRGAWPTEPVAAAALAALPVPNGIDWYALSGATAYPTEPYGSCDGHEYGHLYRTDQTVDGAWSTALVGDGPRPARTDQQERKGEALVSWHWVARFDVTGGFLFVS